MTKKYLMDLGERVLGAFLTGFLASFAVTSMDDRSMWVAAAGGGVASVMSLVKGLVSKRVGDSQSASLTKP